MLVASGVGRGRREPPGLAKTIGIVAVSHHGSSLCYRALAERASRRIDPPDQPTVILHNLPLAQYIDAMRQGDWMAVGTMLACSAEALAAAGADFCILPDNLAHHAAHFAAQASPIPWLNMIELVADAVTAERLQTVGIVGTRMVMNGSIYQSMLGLRGVSLLTPPGEDMEAIDSVIFGELIFGKTTRESRDRLADAVCRLGERGCEGVIYGSTELPLLLAPAKCPLKAFDPVDLLVEGALSLATHP